MRKVLLRIVFDQLFRLESVGNELHVGFGWAILTFLMIAAVGLTMVWRTTRSRSQVISSLVFWAIIPIGLAVSSFTSLWFVRTGIPVFGYGFMLFVGFTSATWLAGHRAQKAGLNPEVIWDMMMWLLIPGIIGARIVYLLQYGHLVFRGKHGSEILTAAIALWDGGIVFYGSIIGGVAGLVMYCRRHNLRPLQLADVIMPSLFVGLGFGRIGCFLYGCCFGAACSLPWAVHFPEDSMTVGRFLQRSLETNEPLLEVNGVPATTLELPDYGLRVTDDSEHPIQRTAQSQHVVLRTIALHPSQLYSSVLAFLLAGLLTWYFPRRPFEGSVLALGSIIYPVNRFILESIRNDEPGRMGTALTFSQLMSIGLFISGCSLMWWLSRRNPPAKTAEQPATVHSLQQ
ncbi:MAG: prolipoprotein diacylglyceryl transferase [Planctomycetaceae bacterium]